MVGTSQAKVRNQSEHPVISKPYNDLVIRPKNSETPIQKVKVESGSDWKGGK